METLYASVDVEARAVPRFAPTTRMAGAQPTPFQTQCSRGPQTRCIWASTPLGATTQMPTDLA